MVAVYPVLAGFEQRSTHKATIVSEIHTHNFLEDTNKSITSVHAYVHHSTAHYRITIFYNKQKLPPHQFLALYVQNFACAFVYDCMHKWFCQNKRDPTMK